MNDADRALRALAERGQVRGAREVYAAASASAPPPRRRALVIAGALVVAGLVVGAVAVDRSSTTQEVVAASVAIVDPGELRPFAPIVGVGDVIIGSSIGATDGAARVLRSEDGGRSFAAVELPDAPDATGPMTIEVDDGRVVVAFSVARETTPASTPSSLPTRFTYDVYEWTSEDGFTWTGGLVATGAPDAVTPMSNACVPSLPVASVVSDCTRLSLVGGGLLHEAESGEAIVQPFELDGAVVAPVVTSSGRLVQLVFVTS